MYGEKNIGFLFGANRSSDLIPVGVASDGFPVYVSPSGEYKSSYALKVGTRPSGPGGAYDGTFTQDFEYSAGSGDLDACNGAEIVTNLYPDGTYAYFITDVFPYIPRCVWGTPDSSFEKGPPTGGRRHMHPPR